MGFRRSFLLDMQKAVINKVNAIEGTGWSARPHRFGVLSMLM